MLHSTERTLVKVTNEPLMVPAEELFSVLVPQHCLVFII